MLQQCRHPFGVQLIRDMSSAWPLVVQHLCWQGRGCTCVQAPHTDHNCPRPQQGGSAQCRDGRCATVSTNTFQASDPATGLKPTSLCLHGTDSEVVLSSNVRLLLSVVRILFKHVRSLQCSHDVDKRHSHLLASDSCSPEESCSVSCKPYMSWDGPGWV